MRSLKLIFYYFFLFKSLPVLMDEEVDSLLIYIFDAVAGRLQINIFTFALADLIASTSPSFYNYISSAASSNLYVRKNYSDLKLLNFS
jgi:hypothetical protein